MTTVMIMKNDDTEDDTNALSQMRGAPLVVQTNYISVGITALCKGLAKYMKTHMTQQDELFQILVEELTQNRGRKRKDQHSSEAHSKSASSTSKKSSSSMDVDVEEKEEVDVDDVDDERDL